MEKLLLLSGASGAGKSSISKELERRFQFCRISSSGYLRSYGQSLSAEGEKHQLQELGDRLDDETDFIWIVDEVAAPTINRAPEQSNWVLDSVRKPRQVLHFRHRFGPHIRHIHLAAPEAVLVQRYNERAKPGDTPYAEVIAHSNEITTRSLGSIADHIFDTSALSPADIAQRIMETWEAKHE
ncbi:AAA family ATPase [Burkholderia gladioli]|uniref:AAA family ATPase n=1 Tax=Burkholderia gladioli TaxID=28095 RepID=UPI0019069AE9|nr:AAA family ATPase [Burkholderia gladioli]MBJ9661242.1 AAA family ATPase [Burkholderia gladioli]